MEDFSVRRQLYSDLIQAYKAVAPLCWTQREAYERMVKQPAPRYYVTAKQAYQVIARMVKGDFELVNMMLPSRRRMYYSLFDEFVSLCEKPMFYNKSVWFVVQHAVARPAPEFFLSVERVRHVRYWLKNGAIDNEGKVVESKLPSYIRTREYQRKKRERKRKWMSEKMLDEIKPQD
jgi:hypothetical protein